MIHHRVRDDNSGDHWGVSSSTDFLPGQSAQVLAQLQGAGEQVRLGLTAEQAEDMAAALMTHAAKVRQAKPMRLDWNEAQIAELDVAAQGRYRAAVLIQEQESAGA